jgi:hypothetical protein
MPKSGSDVMNRLARQTTLNKWAHQDLNLGPAGYEPAALNRAELWARGNSFSFINATSFAVIV